MQAVLPPGEYSCSPQTLQAKPSRSGVCTTPNPGSHLTAMHRVRWSLTIVRAGQPLQESEPKDGAIELGLQRRQDVEPAKGAKRPGSHARHRVRPLELTKCPGKQAEASARPGAGHSEPGGHRAQPLCPATGLNEPASHCWHCVLPLELE